MKLVPDLANLLRGRRLLVVSNREPLEMREGRMVQTVGGLVSALTPVVKASQGIWVAWRRGDPAASPHAVSGAPYALIVVPVSEREAGGYYDGFANRALWPLFHGFTGRARFEDDNFEDYRAVNRRFASAVARLTGPNDVVWVHDYQLALAPEGIRAATGRRAVIAYFHHIPFPAPETFRILPWAREILRGLLGAELVGFHTRSYAENFLLSCERLLGIPVERVSGGAVMGRVVWAGRRVAVGAFPIGIDAASFEAAASRPETRIMAARYKRDFRHEVLVLGVDRLDYTKGLKDRVLAFETFLERHARWRRRASLVQVAVPSRTRVEEYRQMKRELDETVGRVNGRFTEPGWTPVRYINRSFDFSRLVPLYLAADVALITPLRDGMNLVAMEYAASHVDGSGALILSDQAGASETLSGAWLVNPRHMRGVADTLAEVLETPAAERRARMERLRAQVKEGDVHRWVIGFLSEALRGYQDLPLEANS